MTPAVTSEQLAQDLDGFRRRMQALLHRIGEESRCSGCNARIYFVYHHQTGKYAPYDPDGQTHFATCPKAKDFKRKA